MSDSLQPYALYPPVSPEHGIIQARILEWGDISYSRASSQARDRTRDSCVSRIDRRILYHWTTWEAPFTLWSEVAQSCLTLCNPMGYSLPGFSVHGILQARILEWVVISFSRRSSRPRDWTQVSCIVGRRFTFWAKTSINIFQLFRTFLKHILPKYHQVSQYYGFC